VISGQTITAFTNVLRLYEVAVNLMCVYPERIMNFIPRFGGMHLSMSYIGAFGTLMANTGLEGTMQSAFGGVSTMLSGKRSIKM